jgi:hypothetical protein
MAITDWPEGERPRDNTPHGGLLRRRLTWRCQVKRSGRSQRHMAWEVPNGDY